MYIKKPIFWNKKGIISFILLPLSFLTILINFLKKKSKKNKMNIKTICIGNIYLGGTGKTTLAIKINNVLKNMGKKSCFIKKFYKNQIDEQKILIEKGKLYTNRRRIEAIKNAISDNYKYAVLDDGLQDSTLKYDISIVCFNNKNWIGNGMLLPAGPLREKLSSLKNYDIVFFVGNDENVSRHKEKLKNINPNIDIFDAKYEPVNLEDFDKNKNYFAFSGVGNHETFLDTLRLAKLNIVENKEFPDHFDYSSTDIKNLIEYTNDNKLDLVTTKKDFIKIDKLSLNKIKYLDINLVIKDEIKLLKKII